MLQQAGSLQVVLLLDVDFLPPEELSRIFSARQEYQSTLVYLYNNAVIVLPAFEPLQGGAEGNKLALKLAKGTSIPPTPCPSTTNARKCWQAYWHMTVHVRSPLDPQVMVSTACCRNGGTSCVLKAGGGMAVVCTPVHSFI